MALEDEEVKRLAADPKNDEYARLLVTVARGYVSEVSEQLKSIDGCYEYEELGFDILRVVVDQTAIEEIESIDNIVSVELEDKLQVLSTGN